MKKRKNCVNLIKDEQIDVAKLIKTIEECEAGRVIKVPDLDSVKYALPPSDLTRIADALEKIARELSRANELKACKLRSQAGRDSDLERIDEIMED